MDICSIVAFREALKEPATSFSKLNIDRIYPETIHRTTHFAECRAVVDSVEVYLHVPITPHSATLADNANRVLFDMRNDSMTHFELRHREMLCNKLTGSRCSVLVEQLPQQGVPLCEAIYSRDRDSLMRGCIALDRLLSMYNISLNNLTARSIIVDNNGVWHPIRQYYATSGYGNDARAFARLKERIECDATHFSNSLHDTELTYTTQRRTPLADNRRRVVTSRGVGYEDCNGRLVIEDRYMWASDFAEGRATVKCHNNKMGVIDKSGNEIIPPIYDFVEYIVDDGSVWVSHDGRCATFDYMGNIIYDWRSI